MGFNLIAQGENVHLAFSSTAAAAVAAAMTILDSNFNPRPLQPFERLVIDDMLGNITSGTCDVLISSTSNSSTLITSINTAVGLDLTAKEGVSLPVGVTPQVLPVGSGSTATIKISGNGRIVEGTTQGVWPNWRESQNSRGL